MEARMCFEFYHGLADISKFYPLPLALDKIQISANPCKNSKYILASMIYFLNISYSNYFIGNGTYDRSDPSYTYKILHHFDSEVTIYDIYCVYNV